MLINIILQAKLVVAFRKVTCALCQQTYKEQDYGNKFNKLPKSFM